MKMRWKTHKTKKTLISWFSVRNLCSFLTNGKERGKNSKKLS